MAKYFSIFPKVLYSFDGYKTSEYITDITARFSFEESLKDNFSAYFLYTIKDGETPEILAAKYYDSPNKHWIILMMNNIVDPRFDWPLSYSALNNYIDIKYQDDAGSTVSGAGIEWSKYNTKAYYKVETITSPDGTINVNKYEIDFYTYDDVPASIEYITLEDGSVIKVEISRETQSYYDYEIETNDNKREIKLLKREFLTPIEIQLKQIFE